MNDYKMKIDKYVGLLLNAEESEINLQLILDADICYDIAKELQYTFDKDFYMDSEDEFEEYLSENDILGIEVMTHSDGNVEYFLQPIVDGDGNTYPNEDSELIFIQSDLIDCIDLSYFEGNIIVLNEDGSAEFIEFDSENNLEECDGDCSNCSLNDEDYETEIEEDAIEVLLGELLDTLSEIKQSDIKGFNIALRRKLTEAYEMGLDEGCENAVEEIKDTLDNMVY